MSVEDVLQAIKPSIGSDEVFEDLQSASRTQNDQEPGRDPNDVVQSANRDLFARDRISNDQFSRIELAVSVARISGNNAALIQAVVTQATVHSVTQ